MYPNRTHTSRHYVFQRGLFHYRRVCKHSDIEGYNAVVFDIFKLQRWKFVGIAQGEEKKEQGIDICCELLGKYSMAV